MVDSDIRLDGQFNMFLNISCYFFRWRGQSLWPNCVRPRPDMPRPGSAIAHDLVRSIKRERCAKVLKVSEEEEEHLHVVCEW